VPKALKNKSFRDPVTGLKFTQKGAILEMTKPRAPKLSGGESDVEELAQEAHRIWVNDEVSHSVPDTCVSDLSSMTYYDAVQMGFKGHMSNWCNNILAGAIVEGEVDRTPEKVTARLR